MKHTKLWAIIMFLAITASITLIAFAIEQSKITPVEPLQGKRYFKPPENATILPDLGPILFDLSLSTREITISKRQPMNITITITSISTEEINLSLAVGTEDAVPTHSMMPLELPSGIIASFDKPIISVDASSEVTVNLTLTISDQASSGIYTLGVFAIQRKLYGSESVGAYFRLTIP